MAKFTSNQVEKTPNVEESVNPIARRDLLVSGAVALMGVQALPINAQTPPAAGEQKTKPPLALVDYQPKSMLITEEHLIPKARYPVIDTHTHVIELFKDTASPTTAEIEQLNQIVRWMDQLNLQLMVNLTGGSGDELARSMADLDRRHPGRFRNCVEPMWDKITEPDYPARQAQEIERAKRSGAIGLKILKKLGLTVREHGDKGPLVHIDDSRFDPMWEAAGALGMPVFIHTADPDAFFLPVDRFNERYEELARHPEWSFYGKDYPSKTELLAERNRVIARHPRTTFVALHVANHPENLDDVSTWLDQYSNMRVDIAARAGELGRQPRRARKFFDRYQDRILFGTDASPNGVAYPQQYLTPKMYQIYFRFLQTSDEYFDYAPSPIPPQGRWKIFGIELPDEILKKVYHNNAARLLGLPAVA